MRTSGTTGSEHPASACYGGTTLKGVGPRGEIPHQPLAAVSAATLYTSLDLHKRTVFGGPIGYCQLDLIPPVTRPFRANSQCGIL